MGYIITGTHIFARGRFQEGDLLLEDGLIRGILPSGQSRASADKQLPFPGAFLFPGLIDVHVHLREPGFLWKECIRTGSLAAAHGGFSTVCAMPNLSPVPDSPATLEPELAAIARDAAIHVLPYGAITMGQQGERLSDMEGLAPLVCAFSDDGRGVQKGGVMRAAMEKAKALGRLIVAHCEDESLLGAYCVHPGPFAQALGLRGNPPDSEWKQVERDIALVRETACAYHVCHISCKESVKLIREAKAEGLDISCETAPHYLLLDESMLRDEGRFKMNPPIRSREDREALIAGLLDGTVDMIATDHAPHSREEKSKGFKGSLNGVVGLETAFPALYTGLVKTGILSLERLLELMQGRPSARFGIPSGIEPGMPGDLCIFDLERQSTVDPAGFYSMGRSTPFAGRRLYGKCLLTMAGGKIAYQAEKEQALESR